MPYVIDDGCMLHHIGHSSNATQPRGLANSQIGLPRTMVGSHRNQFICDGKRLPTPVCLHGTEPGSWSERPLSSCKHSGLRTRCEGWMHYRVEGRDQPLLLHARVRPPLLQTERDSSAQRELVRVQADSAAYVASVPEAAEASCAPLTLNYSQEMRIRLQTHLALQQHRCYVDHSPPVVKAQSAK